MTNWPRDCATDENARLNCYRFLLLILLGVTSAASAQERHLRTYTMRHALPEQVLPALLPQLSDGSSAQAFQGQLILNVSNAEYRDALQLLDQLDVAARSLLISVRTAGDSVASTGQYGINGQIGSGNVQVRSGDGWSTRTEVRAIQSSQHSNTGGSQQVRAVEGMPAFIATGASYPVTSRSAYGSSREMIPVESGFYASARIIGSEVVIDIDQRDDHVQGRQINTQNIQTQVRGRLGEWITLGGVQRSENNDRSDLLARGNSTGSRSADIAIRVELAPQ